MAKIIKLTESDLEKIVRKVISEQSKKNISEQWLRKLLGASERSLLSKFGSKAVSSVDQLFMNALKNPKNITMSPEGAITLVSAKGTKISHDFIEGLLLNLANGSLTVDEVAKGLPRYLPGDDIHGRGFRQTFLDIMSSVENKATTPTSSKVGGNIPKVTNDMSNARKMPHGGYAGSN